VNTFTATTIAGRASGTSRHRRKTMDIFYVIDGENHSVSWADEGDPDCGEQFKSEAAAVKRAKALAESEPGKTFLVCKPVKHVSCAVADPVVSEV
jgi:hypothetical protein